MSTELNRVSELAREDRVRQFSSIAHFLTEAALVQAFRRLRQDASAGVDGVTYRQYAEDAPRRIAQLHARVKSKQYRVQPLRRIYIAKEDGRQRPISIPCLEDKIVQKATVTLLNAIYERDFLDCSYGFRPGRSAHDALDEVGRVICRGRVSYVLDFDISGYFDAIVRSRLVELIEKRVTDGSLLRLIGKWIHVGIVDDGRLLYTKTGTGQGQVISPLLANIYLHYVLDTWFAWQVKPRLRGAAYEIRFADDGLLCFQYREDAERVLRVLPKRLGKYGLQLHPEKTRLLHFGRSAWQQAQRPGQKQVETFDFLGLTHVCARSRRGRFTVHVRTMRSRFRRAVQAVSVWCQQHRHDPVADQCSMLNAKLRGHYQYYGRPTNYRRLWQFYRAIRRIWRGWLSRRTRGAPMPWPRFVQLLRRHPLQRPRITHPWASSRSTA